MCAVLAIAYSGEAFAQQDVNVPSLERQRGEPIMLVGHWWPAAAAAPVASPAMLLLHGCGGIYAGPANAAPRRIGERYTELAGRLNAQGVHVLALDSLTPRGETELCTQKAGQRKITQFNRRLDALGALSWLAAQPQVDAKRLGVFGWSNGGSTVLAATNGRRDAVRGASHRASLAVAFYPGCETDLKDGYTATAPLLMLLGAEDDWTPAAPCQALARAVNAQGNGAGPLFDIEVYPGAHHGFDGQAALRLRRDVPNGVNPGQGVHVGGHAVSRDAARGRLAAFLQSQWGLP